MTMGRIIIFFTSEIPQTPVELITYIMGMDSGTGSDYLNDLFEHIEENSLGVYVDDEYVPYDDFKHLFE